jgi:hypothetical protein
MATKKVERARLSVISNRGTQVRRLPHQQFIIARLDPAGRPVMIAGPFRTFSTAHRTARRLRAEARRLRA